MAKTLLVTLLRITANHDGELSRAIDLIWQAADGGANAAKFNILPLGQ